MKSLMSARRRSCAEDDPEKFYCGNVNCYITTAPYNVTCLRPFVPSIYQSRHAPFVDSSASKKAINSIRALKRLRNVSSENSINTTNDDDTNGGLVIISGHAHGHLIIWSGDSLKTLSSTVHYNRVTVRDIIVTNSNVLTLVERASVGGKDGDDDIVYVWDMVTMELLVRLSGHSDRVTCMTVNPEDEKHILTGSLDRTVVEWYLPSKVPVAIYMGHTMAVTHLTFIFGKYFVSGGVDCLLFLWSADPSQQKHKEAGKADFTHPNNMSGGSSKLWGSSQRPSLVGSIQGDGKMTNIMRRACIQKLEGHSGQISYMECLSHVNEGGLRGNCVKAEGGDLSEVNNSDLPPVPPNLEVKVLTACHGGFICVNRFEFGIPLSKIKEEGMNEAAVNKRKATGYISSDFTLVGDGQLKWCSQTHKALINDVCCDNNVIMSCSTTDGVTFYHTERQSMVKIQNDFVTGVRHLAIDCMRQLVLCGCDNGLIAVYNYSGFASSNKSLQFTERDRITYLCSFHPHSASISGILVELSPKGLWERIISSSTDNSIFVMDFNLNRDAKLIPQEHIFNKNSTTLPVHISRTIADVPLYGSILMSSGNCAYFWNVKSMKSNKPNQKENDESEDAAANQSYECCKGIKQKDNISVLRYYPEYYKVVTGSESGEIQFWNLRHENSATTGKQQVVPSGALSSDSETSSSVIGSHEIKDVDINITPSRNTTDKNLTRIVFDQYCVSDISNESVEPGVCAVALQGSSTNKTGALCLVDCWSEERLLTNILPIPQCPVMIRLMMFRPLIASSSTEKVTGFRPVQYLLLVQMRNGEINLYQMLSSDVNIMLVGQIVKPWVKSPNHSVPNYLKSVSSMYSGMLPRECEFLMPLDFQASINTHYETPRIDMLYIENHFIKCLAINVSTATKSVVPPKLVVLFSMQFGAEVIPPTEVLPMSTTITARVACWIPIRCDGILAAVSLEGTATSQPCVALVSDTIEKSFAEVKQPKGSVNATAYILQRQQSYRCCDIMYNGSVNNYGGDPSKPLNKQKRILISSDPYSPEVLAASTSHAEGLLPGVATAITHSPNGRLIAIGYVSGLIQLFDLCTKVVSRRIVAHDGCPVVHVGLYCGLNRMVSCSSNQMRFDKLYAKNLMESPE